MFVFILLIFLLKTSILFENPECYKQKTFSNFLIFLKKPLWWKWLYNLYTNEGKFCTKWLQVDIISLDYILLYISKVPEENVEFFSGFSTKLLISKVSGAFSTCSVYVKAGHKDILPTYEGLADTPINQSKRNVRYSYLNVWAWDLGTRTMEPARLHWN